jgi:hypothetical protein
VRRSSTAPQTPCEETEEDVILNLVLILDNLLGNGSPKTEFLDALELTGQVLEKEVEASREVLEELREMLTM